MKDLVEKLNVEMLSHSSSHLRRLYHLVLPADFYNDNFTDTEDDNNWDLITAEATNFEQHTSTYKAFRGWALLQMEQMEQALLRQLQALLW